MSFAAITVYAACCDRCGERAEYEDYCGYPTQGEALTAATDWYVDDRGLLLCTTCRPCSATGCSSSGGYRVGGVFLCESCWQTACPQCDHPRRLHFAAAGCFHSGCHCSSFPTEERMEVSP